MHSDTWLITAEARCRYTKAAKCCKTSLAIAHMAEHRRTQMQVQQNLAATEFATPTKHSLQQPMAKHTHSGSLLPLGTKATRTEIEKLEFLLRWPCSMLEPRDQIRNNRYQSDEASIWTAWKVQLQSQVHTITITIRVEILLRCLVSTLDQRQRFKCALVH